tara:strand:- start:813 stop:1460 length:648 start_codon:yes stop_codon:yes gene_type:complete
LADIFNEIDEDIRRERYQKLWKTYGKFLIIAVIIFFLGAAIYVAWNNYLENLKKKEGDIFSHSLEMIDKESWDGASSNLYNLYISSTSGYRALAMLQHASVLIKNNKTNDAIEIYRDLVEDGKSDIIFRDLARYLIVIHTFDFAKDVEIKEQLSYLLDKENPWYYSASEIEGFRLIRQGKYNEAEDIFLSLSDDIETPSGIRIRSAEIIAKLRNR